MSDEPAARGPGTDEPGISGPGTPLSSRLAELAVSGESPPPVSGAEIRGRAVRRRRRRRTAAASAGACAAACLAAVVLANLANGSERGSSPAASAADPARVPGPSVTSAAPRARPDATIDLTRRVLTVDGRRLPVTSGAARTPTVTGRMTVTGRQETRLLPSEEAGPEGAYVKVPWVIRFSGRAGEPNFIGALTYDRKVVGVHDVTSGWIGLRDADAKWLYERLGPGSVIDVERDARATSGMSP
ncbi:L,D-transpeptidase [Streptomyces sp. NPDC008313]|uniref:L,D-transpeptidase n=1 Tax=Streptomyces sp. NPDC008313 TaxID=3364826 RepID=UPI0036EFC8DE